MRRLFAMLLALGATPALGQTTRTEINSGQTCVAGTTTGAQVVGPLAPRPGIAITVELSGATWPGGTAQLLRSSDGGTTQLPLRPADTVLGTMTGFGVDQPWIEAARGATLPPGLGFYESLPGAGISYKVCN